MSDRVAIIGIGQTAARPASGHLSFKELMFEAAQRAYLDAGVDAREIDSFVTCAEDLTEGISIFDEYTPDPLGAVQKPMHTLTEDGLVGIADGVMQIRAGLAGLVAVEAHSKSSNVEHPHRVIEYALDPVYNRPLHLSPHAIAALEMNVFLHESGVDPQHCAQVVVKNRRNALRNIAAAYPSRLDPAAMQASPFCCYPLRQAEIAQAADGCVVVVLAAESRAQGRPRPPVWVRAVGFASDSPTMESRTWGRAEYARLAGAMAYRQAGIQNPAGEIDLFEVDDSYAFKELQHLIALGLYNAPTDAGRAVAAGETAPAGKTPVNVSGGSLGLGHALEAAGLYRLAEVVLQLRGEAGARQLPRAKTGLAQSWRGVPTTSGAVVIAARE